MRRSQNRSSGNIPGAGSPQNASSRFLAPGAVGEEELSLSHQQGSFQLVDDLEPGMTPMVAPGASAPRNSVVMPAHSRSQGSLLGQSMGNMNDRLIEATVRGVMDSLVAEVEQHYVVSHVLQEIVNHVAEMSENNNNNLARSPSFPSHNNMGKSLAARDMDEDEENINNQNFQQQFNNNNNNNKYNNNNNNNNNSFSNSVDYDEDDHSPQFSEQELNHRTELAIERTQAAMLAQVIHRLHPASLVGLVQADSPVQADQMKTKLTADAVDHLNAHLVQLEQRIETLYGRRLRKRAVQKQREAVTRVMSGVNNAIARAMESAKANFLNENNNNNNNYNNRGGDDGLSPQAAQFCAALENELQQQQAQLQQQHNNNQDEDEEEEDYMEVLPHHLNSRVRSLTQEQEATATREASRLVNSLFSQIQAAHDGALNNNNNSNNSNNNNDKNKNKSKHQKAKSQVDAAAQKRIEKARKQFEKQEKERREREEKERKKREKEAEKARKEQEKGHRKGRTLGNIIKEFFTPRAKRKTIDASASAGAISAPVTPRGGKHHQNQGYDSDEEDKVMDLGQAENKYDEEEDYQQSREQSDSVPRAVSPRRSQGSHQRAATEAVRNRNSSSADKFVVPPLKNLNSEVRRGPSPLSPQALEAPSFDFAAFVPPSLPPTLVPPRDQALLNARKEEVIRLAQSMREQHASEEKARIMEYIRIQAEKEREIAERKRELLKKEEEESVVKEVTDLMEAEKIRARLDHEEKQRQELAVLMSLSERIKDEARRSEKNRLLRNEYKQQERVGVRQALRLMREQEVINAVAPGGNVRSVTAEPVAPSLVASVFAASSGGSSSSSSATPAEALSTQERIARALRLAQAVRAGTELKRALNKTQSVADAREVLEKSQEDEHIERQRVDEGMAEAEHELHVLDEESADSDHGQSLRYQDDDDENEDTRDPLMRQKLATNKKAELQAATRASLQRRADRAKRRASIRHRVAELQERHYRLVAQQRSREAAQRQQEIESKQISRRLMDRQAALARQAELRRQEELVAEQERQKGVRDVMDFLIAEVERPELERLAIRDTVNYLVDQTEATDNARQVRDCMDGLLDGVEDLLDREEADEEEAALLRDGVSPRRARSLASKSKKNKSKNGKKNNKSKSGKSKSSGGSFDWDELDENITDEDNNEDYEEDEDDAVRSPKSGSGKRSQSKRKAAAKRQRPERWQRVLSAPNAKPEDREVAMVMGDLVSRVDRAIKDEQEAAERRKVQEMQDRMANQAIHEVMEDLIGKVEVREQKRLAHVNKKREEVKVERHVRACMDDMLSHIDGYMVAQDIIAEVVERGQVMLSLNQCISFAEAEFEKDQQENEEIALVVPEVMEDLLEKVKENDRLRLLREHTLEALTKKRKTHQVVAFIRKHLPKLLARARERIDGRRTEEEKKQILLAKQRLQAGQVLAALMTKKELVATKAELEQVKMEAKMEREAVVEEAMRRLRIQQQALEEERRRSRFIVERSARKIIGSAIVGYVHRKRARKIVKKAEETKLEQEVSYAVNQCMSFMLRTVEFEAREQSRLADERELERVRRQIEEARRLEEERARFAEEEKLRLERETQEKLLRDEEERRERERREREAYEQTDEYKRESAQREQEERKFQADLARMEQEKLELEKRLFEANRWEAAMRVAQRGDSSLSEVFFVTGSTEPKAFQAGPAAFSPYQVEDFGGKAAVPATMPATERPGAMLSGGAEDEWDTWNEVPEEPAKDNDTCSIM